MEKIYGQYLVADMHLYFHTKPLMYAQFVRDKMNRLGRYGHVYRQVRGCMQIEPCPDAFCRNGGSVCMEEVWRKEKKKKGT